MKDCSAPLHQQAAEGIRLFNAGHYFEAHEALEAAWNDEQGASRDLYRGILQVSVVYLHVSRGNYEGVIKVYERSRKWLKDWPAECRGVQVAQLRNDVQEVVAQVRRLGKNGILGFDRSLLKPIIWDEKKVNQKHVYICDRCGQSMHEKKLQSDLS